MRFPGHLITRRSLAQVSTQHPPHRACPIRSIPHNMRSIAVCKPSLRAINPLHSLRRQLSSQNARLSDARLASDGLHVSWSNGSRSRFDPEFLFDHCRCPRCFHGKTKQRLKSLQERAPILETPDLRLHEDGLTISWSSGAEPHRSQFPNPFLLKAAYDPPIRSRHAITSPLLTLWDSSIQRNQPSVSYSSFMAPADNQHCTELEVLDCLNKIQEFGFCFIEGVPATPKDTEVVIRRLGNIRETHYGGFWDFTADMSHGDLAYSSEALPVHTDTSYLSEPAGLQIFHLLSHVGAGGSTVLVDGFYAASLLREKYPEDFSILSRLSIPHHASGTPGTLLRPKINQPVLLLNNHEELAQVRWNNEDRGVLGEGWSANEVQSWYRAARRFESILRDSAVEYQTQLKPGTVIVIDNWRVLHGRTAFTGERRMCGAYVGVDEWRSRRAVLSQQSSQETDELWGSGW